MTPDQIPHRPPIEGLAYEADASVQECLHHGARWTLHRMLERRLAIISIMVVCRVGGHGIGYRKGVVSWATEERVRALGEAVDRSDAVAAVAVLDEWMTREHDENERFARGLLAAFGHAG